MKRWIGYFEHVSRGFAGIIEAFEVEIVHGLLTCRSSVMVCAFSMKAGETSDVFEICVVFITRQHMALIGLKRSGAFFGLEETGNYIATIDIPEADMKSQSKRGGIL